VRVVVYDSFTLQPLPVLDPERADTGTLLIGEVEVVGD
jgi:hypothetical protein